MSGPEAIEFRVLGRLELVVDGRVLPLGSPKQRALLALLLLHANTPVTRDRLIDEIWGETAPPSVNSALHVYLSRLRKLVGDRLVRETDGYRLRVEPARLDVLCFERLAREGREALADGDAERAAEVLGAALALWRGPMLSGLSEPFATAAAGRLEQARVACLEDRIDAELALGRGRSLTAELEALVAEHPYRERLRGQLMLALYRSGRQAGALDAYQDARRELHDELGLEPGPQLKALERAILRQDPLLAAPSVAARRASAAPVSPGRRVRRGPRAVVATGVLIAAATLATATVVGLTRGPPRSASAALSANAVGMFEPGNGSPIGQIPLRGSPSAAAAGAGSLWVADVDAHSVSRIDPAKRVAIQTVQVGHGPAGIAFGGGFAWVSNGLDGTVSKIDPRTNTTVQTIGVGGGPAGLAVDARSVWVANSTDGTVTRIDRGTGKTGGTIPVGQTVDGIAVGYGSLWVTSFAAGTVTRVDPRSTRVLQIVQSGSGADAVAAGAGSIWVANDLDGTVTRIDPATDRVAATIAVDGGPNGIAAAPGAIWVSGERAGTLSRIDPARNAVVQTVRTGNRPQAVVLDAGALFVAVRASGAGHRGGVLRVLTSGELSLVDPALENPSGILALTNDGLTGFRRVGGRAGTRLVPDLAVSLPAPTDHGRSYTFQLRPGIHYSTGAAVQPRDVRRGIERTLALDRSAAVYYVRIVGAPACLAAPNRRCDLSTGILTEPGSNTVTFHLSAPDPNFLYALALPSAYAVPATTPLHPRGFLPATGPYQIAAFDGKRAMRLVRNPRFREWSPAAQPAGFPDVIVTRVGGSADDHAAAVLRGAADLSDVTAASPAVLAALGTQHASQFQRTPFADTLFLFLNTRLPPFDDVRVRRALNLAIDRNRLRNLTVGHGLGQLTCQVLPPGFDGYRRYCPYTAGPNPTGVWTAPDLARARRLVRASGTAGQSVTVWIPRWIEYDAAPGRYVVSVLRSLGYRARFRFAADPYRAEHRLGIQAGFFGWYADFASPAGFITPALSCSSYDPVNSQNQNPAEFCDPAIDRAIERAQGLQTSDPQTATRLWAEIDHDITDAAPWVTFANGVVFEVVSTRVRNYQYSPQWGTLLDQLWVR